MHLRFAGRMAGVPLRKFRRRATSYRRMRETASKCLRWKVKALRITHYTSSLSLSAKSQEPFSFLFSLLSSHFFSHYTFALLLFPHRRRCVSPYIFLPFSRTDPFRLVSDPLHFLGGAAPPSNIFLSVLGLPLASARSLVFLTLNSLPLALSIRHTHTVRSIWSLSPGRIRIRVARVIRREEMIV